MPIIQTEEDIGIRNERILINVTRQVNQSCHVTREETLYEEYLLHDLYGMTQCAEERQC